MNSTVENHFLGKKYWEEMKQMRGLNKEKRFFNRYLGIYQEDVNDAASLEFSVKV